MLLLELDPTHVCRVDPDDASWWREEWKYPGDENLYNTNHAGNYRIAKLPAGYGLHQTDEECEGQDG